MALIAQQRVHQNSDHEHADAVAQIGIFDFWEQIFHHHQRADEGGRGKPDDRAEQGKHQQRLDRRLLAVQIKRLRHFEGRLQPEENAADEGGGAGRQRDGQEGARAQFWAPC